MKMMVDSGAFSAFTRGEPVGLGEYIQWLQSKSSGRPFLYVNLDVIGDDGSKSYRNWITMRKEGLAPIPVYHIGTPEKYLVRYLERTNFIAIGAIASMDKELRRISLDRVWKDFLTGRSGLPITKCHALGMTSPYLMARYPWYSVDSTAWLVPAIWGRLLLPGRSNEGGWNYSKRWAVKATPGARSSKWGGDSVYALTPHQKRMARQYLEEIEVPWGFWEEEENPPESREEKTRVGRKTFYTRAYVNTLFYQRLADGLPFPRQFQHNPPKTLFQTPPWGVSRKELTEQDGSTRMFHGGTYPIEDLFRQHPKIFHRETGVIITYFNMRRGAEGRDSRRFEAYQRNVTYAQVVEERKGVKGK